MVTVLCYSNGTAWTSLTGSPNKTSQVDLYPSGSSSYVGLTAPAAVPSTYQLALPATAPVPGQVMTFSAPAGGLSTGSWITPMSTAGVGSISSMPSASISSGQYYIGTDSTKGCATGGGTGTVLCYSNGTSWTSLSGSANNAAQVDLYPSGSSSYVGLTAPRPGGRFRFEKVRDVEKDFSFDPSLGGHGGYILNLSTEGLPPGGYVIFVTYKIADRSYGYSEFFNVK
jgi:hypothetical protein